MAKYLMLWELDMARIPVDPKERATGWAGLMAMVEKDLERGISKDWGAIVGEEKGYVIVEGSEMEIALLTQQYSPYVRFVTHPIMSAHEVGDMLKAMGT